MDEILNRLVHELKKIAKPYTLESLSFMLTSYEDLFKDDVNPSLKSTALWSSLRNICFQIREWEKLAYEEKHIQRLKEEIEKYNQSLKSISKKIKPIEEKILTERKTLDSCFPTIQAEHHAYLLNQNSVIALFKPSNLKQQSDLLKAHAELLKNQFNALHKEEVILEIAQITMLKDAFQERLKLLISDVNFDEDNTSFFQDILSKKDKLTYLKSAFQLAQQNLTLAISEKSIQEQILKKEGKVQEIEAELLSLDFQIDQSSLPIAIKSQLCSEYAKSDNKEVFIEQMKSKADWGTSFFNLNAWYLWSVDPNFKDKNEQTQSKLHLLLLLKKQEFLQLTIQEEKQQIKYLNGLLNSQQPIQNQVDSSELYDSTLNLLREYKPDYTEKEPGNCLDLFSDIIDALVVVSKQIEYLEEVLNLLSQLKTQDERILELRTKNAFMLKTKELIPNATDLLILKTSQSTRINNLNDLAQKQKRCEEAISLVRNIETWNKQLRMLKNEKVTLKQELLFDKQKLLSETIDLTHHNEKQEQIKACLGIQISLLETITNTTESEEIEILQPATRINYQEQLNEWNQQIRNSHIKIPDALFIWYQELFVALQNAVNNDDIFYQACYLLRDILFELKQSKFTNQYSTLLEYKRICPNPLRMWSNLTNLKPNLEMTSSLSNELKSSAIQTKLQALYQHQQTLQNKHPHEATLLYELTVRLHQLALVVEEDPNHPSIPLIQQSIHDPRYQPLQQHRGWGKIIEWIAELSAMLLKAIHKTEVDYRNLCFFKKTQTQKLLDNVIVELDSDNRHSAPSIFR